jgi:hypothetical protein
MAELNEGLGMAWRLDRREKGKEIAIAQRSQPDREGGGQGGCLSGRIFAPSRIKTQASSFKQGMGASEERMR